MTPAEKKARNEALEEAAKAVSFRSELYLSRADQAETGYMKAIHVMFAEQAEYHINLIRALKDET